jgi:uncharacterized Zn finger protein (UPF0148 family)
MEKKKEDSKKNNINIGELTEAKCPSCGSYLLVNKLGQMWCSNLDCKYGLV